MAAHRARSGLGLYVLLGLFGLTTVFLGRYMGGDWPIAFPAISALLALIAATQDLAPLGDQRIEIRGGELRVRRLIGARSVPLSALEPSWAGESLRLRSGDGRVDVVLPDLTDDQAISILEAVARSHWAGAEPVPARS